MRQEVRLSNLAAQLAVAETLLAAASESEQLRHIVGLIDAVAEDLIAETGWLMAESKGSKN